MLSWLFDERDHVKWGPLLAVSGCGIAAAVGFGVAEAYLPPRQAWRSLLLGMVTSGAFWLCLFAFIAVSGVRPLELPGDLVVAVVATLICGSLGGLVLSLRS